MNLIDLVVANIYIYIYIYIYKEECLSICYAFENCMTKCNETFHEYCAHQEEGQCQLFFRKNATVPGYRQHMKLTTKIAVFKMWRYR